MGNKIKMTESKLISMIERVIAEQASAAGFGYGFVREVETAPTTPLSAQERELSWGKLRELMKDFYINYKEKFGDVQPNEFNEIEMILLGIIDMARVKNINGKDPDVIAQYLKQHMKRLPAAGDPDVDGGDAGDTPPQPRDAEVKKMFENRLRRTLVNEQSCPPCTNDDIHQGAMALLTYTPQLGDHGITQNFVDNMHNKSAQFYGARSQALGQKTVELAGLPDCPGNLLVCKGYNPMWQAQLINRRNYVNNCGQNPGSC